MRRYRPPSASLVLASAMATAVPLLAWGQSLFAGPGAPAFTTEQALQGKTAYVAECISCHGANLDDGQFGPPLKGPAFRAKWSGQTREALLTYITTRMPPAGPGSLSVQTYAGIEAYMFQANGVAARGAGVAAVVRAAPQSEAEAHPVTPLPGRDATYRAAIDARRAKLDAIKPVTDAMLREPSGDDWLIWRRTYSTLGHSPLKQIGKANVATLRQAWSWSLPLSQNEITPLVHDGVMFVNSGNAVQALDAVTGDLLWQYIRALPDELGPNGRNTRVKSMAIYGERLYVPTADGHLVALEMKTGKLVFDHEIYSDALGARKGQPEGVALHLDGGPIVARGKVIIGVSLGITNAKGGCFIVGLDAQTGEEAWRFNTVDQSPVGQDSWNGAPVNERYGGGIWTAGSYDPELNLVYFGVGNTYDSATLLQPHAAKGRSNDGLYTDATVALDADTGKLAWHFQHMNRDVWDLDWVFEQTLVTLPVDGKPRKLVVTGGKIAMFDAVDRKTGEYVFTKDLGLQNIVIAVDPKTGKKTTDPALEPEAGKAKLLCPGSSGARSWPTTAFNPATNILYVPMIEACTDYTYAPRSAAETAAGGSDMRFSARARPDADGKFGRVQAIDLATKKVLWTRRQRAPVASSMLATDGGLVFNGSLDRRFSAFDERTGKRLWSARLNASPSSSPITYRVNGKQYVALVTGGGGSFDSGGRGLTPEIDSPAGGTTVVVFKLPDASDAEDP